MKVYISIPMTSVDLAEQRLRAERLDEVIREQAYSSESFGSGFLFSGNFYYFCVSKLNMI